MASSKNETSQIWVDRWGGMRDCIARSILCRPPTILPCDIQCEFNEGMKGCPPVDGRMLDSSTWWRIQIRQVRMKRERIGIDPESLEGNRKNDPQSPPVQLDIHPTWHRHQSGREQVLFSLLLLSGFRGTSRNNYIEWWFRVECNNRCPHTFPLLYSIPCLVLLFLG